MEREHQRQLKASEKRTKLLEKMLDQERARLEAVDFNERLESLVSAHKECGERFDWIQIYHMPPPEPPERASQWESKASAEFANYAPSMLDKMMGKIESKQQQLQQAVAVAQQRDEQDYQNRYQAYLQAHEAWTQSHQLAEAILRGDTQAYLDAIEDLQPFAEMMELGCRFNYVVHSPHLVEVALTVDGDHIVPSEIKSLSASGKLSTKKMPQGRFYELYQDYVCGCVLRIGREFMAVLPVEMVLVNGYSEMLSPQTGHREVLPVLGVAMPRKTLDQLNFDSIDASDSMRNFIHRMGFKKSAGFNAIEPLTVAELPAEASPAS